MPQVLPLSDVPRWIVRTTERKMPTVAKEVKRGCLRAVWQDPLITEQREKTGTLKASTIPFGGEFVGRGLEYGEGHAPLPETEIDAVVAALEPGDTVGVAEDATKAGFPYGVVMESKYHLYQQTAARVRGRLAGIIAAAIGRTIFRRGT